MEIKNKVIIITGGTSMIATAIVKVLLECDAKFVALFDIKEVEERGRSLVEEFEKEFGQGKVGFFINDVRDRKEFKKKYDEVVEAHTTVDILINNAAVTDESNKELLIEVNFKSTVLCTYVAIEKMSRNHGGKGGTIIHISSIAALTAYSKYPVYAATKQAIITFARALKDIHENQGIRNLVLCPGKTGIVPANLPKDSAQNPRNVALAIAKLIEKGVNGATYVVENEEPAYMIEDPKPYQDRKVATL